MNLNPKLWFREIEDWWFDRSRHVDTSGLAPKPDPSRVVGEVRDSNIYGPVRAANAHAAIRDLPIRDFSEYTFIDIGSGKGRVLLSRPSIHSAKCWASSTRTKCNAPLLKMSAVINMQASDASQSSPWRQMPRNTPFRTAIWCSTCSTHSGRRSWVGC